MDSRTTGACSLISISSKWMKGDGIQRCGGMRGNRALMSKGTTIAKTPKPPYYAVIFTSQRTEGDRGYGQMAERMVELAAQQSGFLGVESARSAEGFGITVSYW